MTHESNKQSPFEKLTWNPTSTKTNKKQAKQVRELEKALNNFKKRGDGKDKNGDIIRYK